MQARSISPSLAFYHNPGKWTPPSSICKTPQPLDLNTYSLPSSESPFLAFRFSFFSFFFLLRSALSSAVSPSWRLRFFDSPSAGSTTGGVETSALGTAGAPDVCSALGSALGSASAAGAGCFAGESETPLTVSGASKSLYSCCHFAGVASLARPYFCKL